MHVQTRSRDAMRPRPTRPYLSTKTISAIIQQGLTTSLAPGDRVLVAFGPKIGFASTLKDALDQVFGAGTGDTTSTPTQPAGPGTPTTPSTPSQTACTRSGS